MSFRVRFTEEAADDLRRLHADLLDRDASAAARAIEKIDKAWDMLETFPFSCRKASASNPFLREVIISFGAFGYAAWFEIERDDVVTVLAVRHQLEDDCHWLPMSRTGQNDS